MAKVGRSLIDITAKRYQERYGCSYSQALAHAANELGLSIRGVYHTLGRERSFDFDTLAYKVDDEWLGKVYLTHKHIRDIFYKATYIRRVLALMYEQECLLDKESWKLMDELAEKLQGVTKRLQPRELCSSCLGDSVSHPYCSDCRGRGWVS